MRTPDKAKARSGPRSGSPSAPCGLLSERHESPRKVGLEELGRRLDLFRIGWSGLAGGAPHVRVRIDGRDGLAEQAAAVGGRCSAPDPDTPRL